LSNVKLGKIIERILGKRDEERRKSEGEPSIQRADSSISSYNLNYKSSRPELIYIKAQAPQSLEDLDKVKNEVILGNIVIIRLGPLAEKSTDDVKKAVGELYDFTQQIGGDIARLGEERVIVTPPFVKIWREKTT